MPSWEETKRAGQTAFTMAGNGFEDVYGSIGNTYQQILTTGHIYPPMSMGGESLTQQITEDAYRQPEAEAGQVGLSHLQHNEPEQGIEPER